MKRLVCSLALILIGCGGSSPTAPTAPGPVQPVPTNIAGTWIGTMTYYAMAKQRQVTYAITVDLAQNGAAVTGSWTAPDVAWNGTITGSTIDNGSDSFTATVTFNYPNPIAGGPPCTGSKTMYGNTHTPLHWNYPPPNSSGSFTGSCPGIDGGVQTDPTTAWFDLQRQ